MLTSDFDYHLPHELIAQTPLEPRDSSRLLVLHRSTGRIEHRHFYDIVEYLRPGDVMVLNESRVIPARLRGRREDTGGKVEFLLLRQQGPGIWQALAQPGRRLKPGMRVVLEAPGDQPPHTPPFTRGETAGSQSINGKKGRFIATVLASEADGIKTVRLEPGAELDLLGETPLPPYIHHRLEDPERYQAVYGRHVGSAAAPTAGLLFTKWLMERLKDAAVELAFVTLHVGLDTFRPIQVEDPTKHKIHTEYFELGRDAANTLNRARHDGRRIIAAGTTSVRVLEQAAQLSAETGSGELGPISGQADIFILPGYKFRLVDALITNFHLPKSTLLMLVSAFAGRELILDAYQEAISQEYRFYSFGDAMMIF